MAKKKKRAFTSKFAMVVVFLIAVIYTFYHVFSLFSTDDLSTIVSGVTTESESIGGRGYIFRDEILLTSDNKGAVDYLVKDGEKVANGSTLADVYSEGGRSSRIQLRAVTRQIELLENSRVGAEPLDMTVLREEVNDTYYNLVSLINSGQAGELPSQIDSIMINLNKIKVMTNGEAAIELALEQYYSIRDKLLKGNSITEYASQSGYFYYYPDGYEEFFSTSALETIDQEYFYGLENYLLSNSAGVAQNVYGKLAPDSGWYLAVALPNEEAEALVEGDKYSVLFPDNNGTRLEMTLDRKVDAPAKKEVICIFYCNRLPNNFSLERAHNVQIDTFSVSGIYVPRSALTKVDGIRGVYVLRGSIVRFRTVEIVYQGYDYVLVSPEETTQGEYYSLGTNEFIITNGNNLFDGRILE